MPQRAQLAVQRPQCTPVRVNRPRQLCMALLGVFQFTVALLCGFQDLQQLSFCVYPVLAQQRLDKVEPLLDDGLPLPIDVQAVQHRGERS